MSEDKTVRLGYSSSSNISFSGTLDTGVTRADWDEMSEKDRADTRDELLYELVDLFELEDDEPDYSGWRGR